MNWLVDEATAPVPMWVITADISDRAVRLYALLSAERDWGTDMASLGRKLLSAKLGCSVDTLDRAKAELERVGAISVVRGRDDSGEIRRNVYRIHRAPPGSRTGAVRVAAPVPLVAAPARPGPLIGTNSSSSSSNDSRLPRQVAGKRVTEAEHDAVDALLAAFNELAESRFAGKDWRRSIVQRMRDHPDLTLDEHLALLRAQFAKPWWKGAPTPSVIWGNDRVFDRALSGGSRAPKKPESVYGRQARRYNADDDEEGDVGG